MSATATNALAALGIFLFGGLVSHAWDRYRRRLKRLRCSAEYFKVAVAADDPTFGTVQVLYDGKPVANVHSARIQLQNESTSDLENVVINIACLERSRILRSIGGVTGSLQKLPFTDEFSRALINLKDPAVLEYVMSHRDYRIPVLNRGATVNFYLVLSRDDVAQPNVTIACDHPGVELRHQAPGVLLLGVPLTHAVVVGFVVTLGATVLLAALLSSIWGVGLIAWGIGITTGLTGVLVVKLWRWIAQLLS